MDTAQGGAVLRADLAGVVEEAFLQSTLYIGAKAMPPLPVPNQFGQYPIVKKNTGNLLRNEVKVRGAGANYPRIQRQYENDNYSCQEYGIEAIVDDSNRENVSRFFDLESSETRWAYRQVQLAHELRVKTALFSRATFTATTSATAYTQANVIGNGVNGFDVGLDIDICKQAIQARGENVSGLTAIMSLNTFNLIRASNKLQNRVRGTISTDSQLTLDTQNLADALQLKQILVGAAAYDTSLQGAASSTMTNIWTDDYIWIGTVLPAAGPKDYFAGGVGYTLFWAQDSDIFQVESYRQEQIRSEIIRARQFTAEKIVLSTAGQLLTTQS
jgi:hypothetical protein